MTSPNSKATGIETEATNESRPESEVCRTLSFDAKHLKITQVQLFDVTDRHNELVQQNSWLAHRIQPLNLSGNLFLVEDLIQGTCSTIIRQSPLPNARPISTEHDLQIRNKTDGGFEVHLLAGGDTNSDPWVVLESSNDLTERTSLLHNWQRGQRPSTPGHQTPRFLSNTWGDRNRDARIQHEFIEGEIDSASKLGVDVVQIDDGWQKGISANSAEAQTKGGIWDGFWAADENFWTPNPDRFPKGLDPLVQRAKDQGMGLGLWFVPDPTHDYDNWQRDADCILGLHNRYGVEHFKIDGVKAESQTAFARLNQFVNKVISQSQGKVVLDLDITAGIRPGYFGMIECGPLFVENRYSDWRGYWPHHTMRNLWKLSQWIDPKRMRFEFLNSTRNLEKYANDPLAPSCYSPATLFASVMMANPLGWFEVSNLPTPWLDEVSELVHIWRNHRQNIFSGTILPIGSAPDGVSPTGWVSISQDMKSGFLLLFRELNEQTSFSLPLNVVTTKTQWQNLAGCGTIASGEGQIHATIDQPLGFQFSQFSL